VKGRTCLGCGAGLCSDEKALYKKLVFRAAEEFLCLDCLSAELNTTPSKLQSLIDYYHRTGICCLFAKIEAEQSAP
jgi:hypothetical protein